MLRSVAPTTPLQGSTHGTEFWDTTSLFCVPGSLETGVVKHDSSLAPYFDPDCDGFQTVLWVTLNMAEALSVRRSRGPCR